MNNSVLSETKVIISKENIERSNNRHYPELPILSAGAIIFREDSVLLVQRGHEPAKGLWSIPGGVIKVGETIYEGLTREILEETGIKVSLKELVEIVERIFRDGNGKVTYHYIILDYLAEYSEGFVKHASDADDAKFVPCDQLSSYQLTEGLENIIKKANRIRRLKD